MYGYDTIRYDTVRYDTVRYGTLENSDKNGLPTILIIIIASIKNE
jgi:hypothetical protein